MSDAQIVIQDLKGFHNGDPAQSMGRLLRKKSYQDLSTIMVIASPNGMLYAKPVQTWLHLLNPMNQKFIKVFMLGMEVGEAYNQMVDTILNNPELSKFKYLLTVEWDNMIPPDGVLKLYESMDTFDVVGGLYWTKGIEGQPMIYGDPRVMPKNFIPQVPQLDAIQECNGLGMGFNLFKIDMFRKIEKPWFKSVQEYQPGRGARCYTQDLYFYEKAGLKGFRFACDTRVRVGHYDYDNDIVW